jgi:hypothetical protein
MRGNSHVQFRSSRRESDLSPDCTHQGRTCKNRPPAVAFPHLPPLRQLPSRVDPDGWLSAIDGTAYVRRVGSDGCVQVDLEPYYIGKQWDGEYVTLHVNAFMRTFNVWHGTTEIKELRIKNLIGHSLPLQEFLDLMTNSALADARRVPPHQRGLRQQPLF